MKTIGKTNEGKYLVEMSYDEHRALAKLAGAEQGLIASEFWAMEPAFDIGVAYPTEGYDLTEPLLAIHAYAQGLLDLNQLKHHIKRLEQAMTMAVEDEVIFSHDGITVGRKKEAWKDLDNYED